MNPKVVIFGEADYGKSTIMGYLYAESENINMDKREKELIEKLGIKNYSSDILYSSLINTDIFKSKTEQNIEVKKVKDITNVTEGIKILKDNDDETIMQSTSVLSETKIMM